MDRSDKSEDTLEKQRDDIASEIDANNAAGDALISLVGERGSMSDVDKLTVHIKEVESITNLLHVLRERLTRTRQDLSQATHQADRVSPHMHSKSLIPKIIISRRMT